VTVWTALGEVTYSDSRIWLLYLPIWWFDFFHEQANEDCGSVFM
jgi:hypothetical protein